jgi:hypothetical protein
MSKRLTELEAGALNAWSQAQQAALYHQHQAKQSDEIELANLKKYEEAKSKEGKEEDVKPHAISAGKIIDDLVSQD